MVDWSGPQTSRNRSHGTVKHSVKLLGVGATAPDWCAVLCSRVDQCQGGDFQGLGSGSPCGSRKAADQGDTCSGLRTEAFQVLAKRQRAVGADWNCSLLPFTVMLISRLASLLCRWNTDDMVLAMLSFRRQFSRYVDRMVISAVRPPSISSQDFFWSRIARSSAYPYFLACVTGRSLNSIGAKTDPWGTPFLSLLCLLH